MTIWLFHISPPHMWRAMWGRYWGDARVGIFKNLPGVIPGRWGFYVLGFEFGSRNPGDPFGAWLKRVGLWPW